MFDSAHDCIEAIKRGEMIVLMDDESRENEGDLVMAAQFVTAEHVNFMVQHARGLLCLTLTEEKAASLDLPLMVGHNQSAYETNFTLSIEAAKGVTTGISAADRATTIQAAIHPLAKPSDIVRPGHVFPIVAKKGGVLARAGHTEASVDLASLAGVSPAGVIIEILKDDGSMARRDDCLAFAKQHHLKIGTIADIIEYRFKHQQTVVCVASQVVKTYWGEFTQHTFEDTIDGGTHTALVKGPITDAPVIVRVQAAQPLDGVGVMHESHWTLPHVMDHLNQTGGILVLLNPHTQTPSHSAKNIGVGSQILSRLGVRQMRVLGHPKRYHALSGFGLEIVEIIPFKEITVDAKTDSHHHSHV